MKKALKTALCVFLSLLMVTVTVPMQAFAGKTDASEQSASKADATEKPIVLHTASGDVEVDDEWLTAFPYGCFAFESSEAVLHEGGDTVEIVLYRLGGTTGRATAYITYNPTVTPKKAEGEYSFLCALSTDDIEIEVEDPSPAAKYDPIGTDSDPEACETKIVISEDDSDYILTVPVIADGYRWQSYFGGRWRKVDGGSEQEIRVAKEDYPSYDFRCIYQIGEDSYCTESTQGVKYVKPDPEDLPEMPADTPLDAEPTFTKLIPYDDPYLAYELPVTFASGEWKKTIRITPKDDNLSECMESSTLILTDNEGGEIGTISESVTVVVLDNDPAEPFELGLVESEGTFDKAQGKAVFTVRRTGGMQEVVSIGYETVDGTAVKGVDYLAQSGELSLFGNTSELYIPIPLIDNGVKTDEKKSFTLRLYDLKGDSEDLCTLTTTEATVYLYNSGTGKQNNLASVLTDSDAIDLGADAETASAVDISPHTVTGTQTTAEKVYADIVTGKPGTKTFTYPNQLVFSTDKYYNNNNYWKSEAYPCDLSLDWHGWVEATNEDSRYWFTNQGLAEVHVNHMAKLFSSFGGYLNFTPASFACPFIGFGKSSDYYAAFDSLMYAAYNPDAFINGFWTNQTITDYLYNTDFEMDQDIDMLAMGYTTAHTSSHSDDEERSESTVDGACFIRRSFHRSSDLYLRIHTANDGESGDGNTATAPENGAALTLDTDVYNEMMPDISIVKGEGGVNGIGKLFVGSKLEIKLKNTATFSPMTDDRLSCAVFLTNEQGKTVAQAEKGTGNTYYLTIMWDSMTLADLEKDYFLNIVMTREQTITLDLTPSVPRKTDSYEIDTDRAGEAAEAFRQSGKRDSILVGHSMFYTQAPYFRSDSLEWAVDKNNCQVDVSGSKVLMNLKLQLYVGYQPTISNTFDNVQCINFGCDHEDKIVFNGRPYAGDEEIYLTLADLSSSDLHFYYYSKEYFSVPSLMNTTVDKAGLYLDVNNSGSIEGTFDAETGYFVLDQEAGDEFIGFLDRDATLEETTLNYLKNEDGSYTQLFLKVYYYMNPRTLADYSGTGTEPSAQVMPALTTSVTDQQQYFMLTDEQRNYRYLISGKNTDGSYTADGHIMYGAAATAIQYVDIPLGGDKSPMVGSEDSSGKIIYTWTPQYEGNLLYPYTEPAPIYIEQCLVGKDFPLAPDFEKSGTLSEKDIANLNGYLGSLVADTAVALCVRQQDKSTGEIVGMRSAKARLASGTDSPDESSSLIPVKVAQDPNQVLNTNTLDIEGDSSSVRGTKSGSDEPFRIDLDTTQSGSKIPFGNFSLSTVFDRINFSVFDTVCIKNGDQFIVGVNVPFLSGGGQWGKTTTPAGIKSGDEKWFDDKDKWALAWQALTNKPSHLTNDGRTVYDAVDNQPLKGWYYGFGFTASFYSVVYIKYDHITNAYEYNKWVIGISLSFTGSFTHRWAVVYVCIAVSLSIDLLFNLRSEREYTEDSLPLIAGESSDKAKIKKGDTQVFPVDYRLLNINFNGKIQIGLYTDQNCTKKVEKSRSGYLESTDKTKTTLLSMIDQKKSRFKDDKTYYLKIEALEDTTISRLVEIVEVSVQPTAYGFEFDPSFSVQGTAGAGASNLKVEGVLRFSIGCTLQSFRKCTHADFSASISIHVVCLFFKFNWDLFGYSIVYDGKQWSYNYRSLATNDGGNNDKKRGGVDYDAMISLPDDMSDTQKVYQQQEKESGQKSYLPTDDSVPFELSGYSSSSDAAKLADGLALGSDYQVVSLKNKDGENVNYVLYHISRSAESSVDSSMLVLSELKMTGVIPGLLNPVEHDSQTPYIPIDDDGTGDLAFRVTSDADSGSLQIVWVNYQKTTDGSVQAGISALSDAVKNTEIKTATFTPGKTKDYITGVEVVSSDKNSSVGMPITAGDATVFVRSNPITDEELEARTELLRSYLASRSDGSDGQESIDTNRIATQRGIWVQNGGSSEIRVKVKGADEAGIALDEGVTVQNMDARKIGDTYYLAYTTTQDYYTDAEGSVTDNKALIANILTVKRMYLRTFTVSDGKINWGMDGKAVLLRTLFDYENGGNTSSAEGSLPDGIYAGGQIIEQRNDPYFTNVKFLNAKLGDSLAGEQETLPLRGTKSGSSTEDFLLFDMNGSTYVIRQTSLERMTGSNINMENGTTQGTIIPFFKPDIAQDDDNNAFASSGRSETTIGVDGDGNLAAVYTAPVEHTSDTALCVSKYDPATGWGSKTILAMNHLSVYEENAALNRSFEDAEKAYLGLLDEDEDGKIDENQKGSPDQFTFANPQIALGNETVTDDEGNVTQKPTLLVLTQGTMTYYKQNTDKETMDAHPILPVDASEVTTEAYPRSAQSPAGLGVYALAYGVGTQKIGNGKLSMNVYDFGIGSSETVDVSFENTGDVGIRGSKDQPATVSLKGTNLNAPLVTWEITENIVPGQKVYLTGNLDLTSTLPAGTELYLSVEEDHYYEAMGGKSFCANTDTLLTIEERPELGFDDYHVILDSIDDNGNAVVNVDFVAANRGTVQARDVKALFSYDTGITDSNGNEIYEPLDISGSNLSVTTEELTRKGASKALQNGVLDLSNINVGYGQHVTGNLYVSPDCFCERTTDAIKLKVELFSAGDEGLPEGEHNEYNSVNNSFVTHVEHETLFSAPSHITVPAGSELRIPVDVRYTTGEEVPHILVTEFPDLNGNTHFSKLAFRYGVFEDGSGEGTLELMPSSEGTGYIRIKNTNTNSFYDIAYAVTARGTGVNVYNDNDRFTFHNVDDSQFNEATPGQNWSFPSGVSQWGADNTAPYLNDLSCSEIGGSFTFTTVAESIDFVFNGTAEIRSTFEGFEPVTITASGGDGDSQEEYATVVFGKNRKEIPHTVTVIVKDGISDSPLKHCYFDRIIEHYNQSELPVPLEDNNPPQIFFSRSFPEAGSVAPGSKVSIKAYIFDETAIASVTKDDKQITTISKDEVGFWTAYLTFTKNGSYTLAAKDDLGNVIKQIVQVDWFGDASQSGAPAVPEVHAVLMKHGADGEDDVELTDDTPFANEDSAYIAASGTTADGSGTPAITVTGITVTASDGLITLPVDEDDPGVYPALTNGWYLVRASDPGSEGESWSATVVEMMYLTKNQLLIAADTVRKAHDTEDPELTYRVWGLLPGDNLNCTLLRESGEDPGAYAITPEDISTRYDYHIIYRGADLIIGHQYSDPVWEWMDIVVIDVEKTDKIDIHPEYYRLDDGDPIRKHSANTKYVLMGCSAECKMLIHDNETAKTDYNICFCYLTAFSPADFCTVNGSNATIHLSLRGENTIECQNNGQIFRSSDSDSTTFIISKDDSGETIFDSFIDSVTDDSTFIITFGEYEVLLGDSDYSFSEDGYFILYNHGPDGVLWIEGGTGDPELYDMAAEAKATFICPLCGNEETVQATVAEDVRDGKECFVATAEINGKTYTSVKAKTLPDSFIIGDATGDGLVTILDATAIQRFLAGLSVPANFDESAADVDGSGTDILDATYIQRYLAGFQNPHRIGELSARDT